EPERTKLLEPLDELERARRLRAEPLQIAHPVRIEPDVPARQLGPIAVAAPWDRRAAEVEGATLAVADDLRRARVRQLLEALDRRRERRDGRIRMPRKKTRDLRDQLRRHERLIALHVDDDPRVVPAQALGHLRRAIRAALVMRTSHLDARTVRTRRV